VRAGCSVGLTLVGLCLGRHADMRALIGRSLVWGGMDARYGDADGDGDADGGGDGEGDARLRDDL
jgi:hypothetical protein